MNFSSGSWARGLPRRIWTPSKGPPLRPWKPCFRRADLSHDKSCLGGPSCALFLRIMAKGTSRADLDPFQGTTSETLGSGPNPAWKSTCPRSARKVHRTALQSTACRGIRRPFESMVSKVSEVVPWKWSKSGLEAPLLTIRQKSAQEGAPGHDLPWDEIALRKHGFQGLRGGPWEVVQIVVAALGPPILVRGAP